MWTFDSIDIDIDIDIDIYLFNPFFVHYKYMLKMIFVYIKKTDNKRSGDTAKAKKNCLYHRCHLRCLI